ncbi:hypothetical protein acdb102_24710 [Acidothermaceae bacterium B102]|nr:hypothetical protein acdb102_24710 [Acidothermaceae bacterium B102]
MTVRSRQRAAAEAARAVTADSKQTHRFPDDWVRRVVELEAFGPTGAGQAEPQRRTPSGRPQVAWLRRSRQPLRHEHVELNGFDVEVTEDEIGVVELHLE